MKVFTSDTPTTLWGHPKGLYVLFFTEMWERFSYYGMRALLMLYMIHGLHMSSRASANVYGWYTGLVYLTPILGGYLADTFLGQRKAIWIGGVLMAIGHFAMAFDSLWAFTVALGFLIVGNGFFKPNISVLVGQLYPQNDSRRDGAFTVFYMGINLGAFLSPLICGWLGQKLGWHYGFAAAGVGMLLGLAVYSWGQSYLGRAGLQPLKKIQNNNTDQAPVRLSSKDWQKIGVIVLLGIFGNIIFWAAFEQAGSSLTLFAEESTRLHVSALKWDMPSSWFQSFNPLFIMLLAPLFSALWVGLAKRNKEPSTPLKFVMGMVLLAAGFGVMVAAGSYVDAGEKVHMGWLTCAYLLHTMGELCVSPVGLSMVTQLAPARLSSVMMGVWLASMALANFVSGLLAAEYSSMAKASFFSMPTTTALYAALALLALSPLLKKMMGKSR
jgi:POT family proton-dependent oligopeptide transporter